MCGIVGIAGNMSAREELTMKRLLHLDSLRGMDSTGLAAARRGGQMVFTAKRATHHFNLFETKAFNTALSAMSSLAFIGHNRSATSGKISDVNAHPFQIGHITGVHNGTLEDRDKIMLEKWLGEEYNVDSEALFAAIAKFGVKEVIPKLSKGRDHYKGAWSLVWWDSKTETLNFLRNEHRPMWYCYSEDFKQIFWASEFWMLDAALEKTGTYSLYKKESEKTPGKTFRFFSTDPDILYSVDVEKLSKGSKERPKIPAVKLAGKEPEEVTGTSYPFGERSSVTHGNVCGNDTKKQTHMQFSKKNIKTKNSSSASCGAIITLVGNLSDPYGGFFNPQEFNYLGHSHKTKGAPECSWCHGDVPFGMSGITVYTRDNVILCTKCSGHDPVSPLSDIAPANRIFVPRATFNELC